ncbi:hypothetical protein F959_01640 [Acinetobacter venetianus RAG-1 = CIP 110063]|uniref:HNH nuclease domain-containing protein n=1 Tax=Acinetobacter venetianus (strain ATCC 31012 / DSM 23050 / BCRC 14357 / CCUG 45561 / CIP 110063 / KCTC 2702 / LMG 19082 / RAG-1) TaxID=1191460 RepID=N8ZYF7_ACIVR|nr:HNH endonuclease [Acinetobacter venetianus]ENV36833.1 hypothetical protein F959_01640 [Acinetobacter venetianus RAG-1 = CIP 110063]
MVVFGVCLFFSLLFLVISEGFQFLRFIKFKAKGVYDSVGINSSVTHAIQNPVKFSKNKKEYKEFKGLLVKALEDGVLTKNEKIMLSNFCVTNSIDINDALDYSRTVINDALHLLLASIISDREITAKDKKSINDICEFLKPDQALLEEVNEIISVIEELSKIRSGDIQPIQVPGLVTKNTESIWAVFDAGYVINEDEMYEGELYITSDRLIFSGISFNVEAPFSGILSYEEEDDVLEIRSKTKKATFLIIMANDGDGLFVDAYIDQAINRYYRRLDIKKTAKSKSRYIPQAVKTRVWELCGGQCVECGAKDYLEFDHIIPIAKGGANTEQNLQVLCGKCNNKKRDKI